MRYILCTVLLVVLFGAGLNAQSKVHTEDLVRFYQAFDSVQTTQDTLKQLEFIQKLYVDQGSEGLKEFMVSRGGNAVEWRKLMAVDKQKLITIRPFALSVLDQKPKIEKKLRHYKKLYPDFQNGEIYFCIGINNSGGTIKGNHVLIGTEVVASNRKDWAVPIVLHEFTHTQQWVYKNLDAIQAGRIKLEIKQVLSMCLLEGMCDFVGELVYGQSLADFNPDSYTAFGLEREKMIWGQLKEEMFLVNDNQLGWLYGGGKKIEGRTISDLGYFMGHQICKSYYNKAKNKKKALHEIINLQLTTDEVAKNFLVLSGYPSAEEIPEIEKKFRESQR